MVRELVRRFNWKLSLIGGVAGIVVHLPKVIYGNDFGAFLGTFGLMVLLGLLLVVLAALNARRQPLASLSMLAAFCLVGWIGSKYSYDVYVRGRWIVLGNQYRAGVLRQSAPENGEFKQIEWDGWGFAGLDTTVYLVFDPDDRLAASRPQSSQKPPGLPCDVADIRRMESHWYVVTFYTDTEWYHCP